MSSLKSNTVSDFCFIFSRQALNTLNYDLALLLGVILPLTYLLNSPQATRADPPGGNASLHTGGQHKDYPNRGLMNDHTVTPTEYPTKAYRPIVRASRGIR